MEGFIAFSLGIIALCMVIITVGMIGVFFVLLGILKTLRELLIEVKIDYKVISPKIHQIIENLESTTSIFGLLSFLGRRKSKKK